MRGPVRWGRLESPVLPGRDSCVGPDNKARRLICWAVVSRDAGRCVTAGTVAGALSERTKPGAHVKWGSSNLVKRDGRVRVPLKCATGD
jgi:hypothetical protein